MPYTIISILWNRNINGKEIGQKQQQISLLINSNNGIEAVKYVSLENVKNERKMDGEGGESENGLVFQK